MHEVVITGKLLLSFKVSYEVVLLKVIRWLKCPVGIVLRLADFVLAHIMGEKVAPLPFIWMEDPGSMDFTPRRTKRKYMPKKREYVGWASRPLIEFLESLGRQTKEALSQDDVSSMVIQYAKDHNLFHREKKKRIVCDERLHSLFGKKTVSRIKVHELLETHFAENQDDSEDESSSEENEKDTFTYSKVQPVQTSYKKIYPKKKVAEIPKSFLAAINSENIKLIYLRRSLVQDLLKFPETFDSKLVGSLVRVKSDPNDIFQKNSHQLLFVTGVKRNPKSDDSCSEVLLEVTDTSSAIGIPTLSDDNFSEDECKDLHQRMKDGSLKQPTIGELEEKVQVLHEDITKHSIARELVLLQSKIDRANEKGWRREYPLLVS
ncbi:hypothetical protein Droror1_Dr00025027 [Drosera rotundifolia]